MSSLVCPYCHRDICEQYVTSQEETPAQLRERQARKLRELRDALTATGFCSIDQQAKVLGVPRSTSWTILHACHKQSGLSPAVVNRMLSTPDLPPTVRTHLLEYVDEKIAGVYGHNRRQLRRFTAGLNFQASLSTQTLVAA
jgi:hypothetical protein